MKINLLHSPIELRNKVKKYYIYKKRISWKICLNMPNCVRVCQITAVITRQYNLKRVFCIFNKIIMVL